MFKPSSVIKAVTSQLGRHLTLVSATNLFGAGLGFLSVLIISRLVTVSEFGLFNMAMSVIIVVSPFASLGLKISMIKFVSAYLGKNRPEKAAEILKVTLIIITTTSSILAVCIYSAATLISVKVFHLPELVPLIKIAAFGVFFITLFNSVKSGLISYKMFKKYASIQIVTDIAKLLALVGLVLSLKLTPLTSVLVFALTPVLGCLLGLLQIKHALFLRGKAIKNAVKHLLSYSKWILMSITFRSATPYVSIFMIAKMLDTKTVGIYALALNLTYIFPIFIKSIISVLLPEVSRFTKMMQFQNYLKKTLKMYFFASVLILPFIFFSKKIILFFFGSRYADSADIFNWLLVAFLLRFGSAMVRSALYALHKPNIVAFVDMFKLIVTIIGCYFLIPFLGFTAPAILAVFINLSALVFLATYTLSHIKTSKAVLSLMDTEVEPL